MDLFDGLVGALRRWYVLIPILVITAALAVVVHGHRATQYVSSTSIAITTKSVFVQPKTKAHSPRVIRQNALIQNGGVILVANLLATGLQQSTVTEAVATAGGTTNYTVAVEQGASTVTQLPIIQIIAKASTSRGVATTMSTLSNRFGPTLEALQRSAGVPAKNYAQYFVLQPVTPPARQILSAARNTGVVIVVGVVVALAISASVDNIVMRRRRRVHHLSDRRSDRADDPEVLLGTD